MIQFPIKITGADNQPYNILIWNGERLSREIAIDLETNVAPFHTRDHKAIVMQAFDGKSNNIYLVRIKDVRRFLNKHRESRLIGHNIAFDMQVLAHEVGFQFLLEWYDSDLVIDTKLLFSLLTLAVVGTVPNRSESSLKNAAFKILGINIDKNADIRTSFDQFQGLEYENMSADHLAYAALDVVYTFNLYCRLLAMIAPHDTYNTLLSHHIQIKGDLVLDQIYKNGIEIDLEACNALKNTYELKVSTYAKRLAMWGLVRGKAGISDAFERALIRLGIADKLPKTASGKTSSSYDDLIEYRHMSFISDYLEMTDSEKMLEFLCNVNSSRIHPQYNTLLKTGRTSCNKGKDACNIQTIPKNGDMRQIFVAKKNKVLFDVDITGMENATLAQILLNKYGYSKLADTINSGKDVHTYYASILFNKEEKKVTKKQRQQAKAAVFGFPGGLGIETFKTFAKGYDVFLTNEEAQIMKDKYFEAFPEMRKYLNECQDGDVYTLTGRKRANATYCAVANTPFQGLGSDWAKLAMYGLFKAEFKLVGFIHDAFLAEEENNTSRYKQMCDIILEAGKKVVPDVEISVAGEIRERWA